jgi:hypothetical protein
MPTQLVKSRNGSTPAPPTRRWLLSTPVPLPALGDYEGLIAVYDLDAVMAFEWGAVAFDLAQEDRALGRASVALLEAHKQRWPVDRQAADPDAYFEADHTVGEQIRANTQQRQAINHAMNLRALALLIVEVRGLDGPEVTDPANPDAWEGWSPHMLDWLTSDTEGHGRALARAQLVGGGTRGPSLATGTR